MPQTEFLLNNHDTPDPKGKRPTYGLWLAGGLGLTGVITMSMAMPFVLPALRKYCLPYVPATDTQLDNLRKAFKKHSKIGDTFLDIGSGDGRICRLAAKQAIYSQVHGVELNSVLVYYSRLHNILLDRSGDCKFYHADLWKFPVEKYDSICIFGVDTMMNPFRDYLLDRNSRPQTIYACRFPLTKLYQVDEIGTGIDTVWVYKLRPSMINKRTY